MKNYNLEVQRLFLEMMLEDAETYVRVQNIYNAENFDRSLRDAAKFIKKHSDDHKTLPTREQIQAATGIELREVPELREGHYDWFLTEFESFSRKQELERAILKAADMIEKGDYDPETGILHVTWRFHYGDRFQDESFEFDMNILFPDQMDRFLEETNWSIIKKYGDYDRSVMKTNSPKQIYLCKKKSK